MGRNENLESYDEDMKPDDNEKDNDDYYEDEN